MFSTFNLSTLKLFPYLLDMLLHKQQQVIEVIKNETGHLKKQTDFHIKEDKPVYSHFFFIFVFVLYL